MMRTREQLHEWLTKVNDLVQTDFGHDMECKAMMPNEKPFTQAEAREMAMTLANVYKWAHRITCEACGGKLGRKEGSDE